MRIARGWPFLPPGHRRAWGLGKRAIQAGLFSAPELAGGKAGSGIRSRNEVGTRSDDLDRLSDPRDP